MVWIRADCAGELLGNRAWCLAQPAGELEGERDGQIAECPAGRDLHHDLRQHRIVGRDGVQAADDLGEAAADGALNR